MKRAAIDLGTNTALLLIAEADPHANRVGRVALDRSTIVRLGEGLEHGKSFSPQARERTLRCLEEYAAAIKKYGLDPADCRAVATAASRRAMDAAEFYAEVQKRTGIRFRIISGEEEGRLTFLGTLSGDLGGSVDLDSAVVMDIGGGSTEWITARGATSIDIGSVRLTERFFPSDPAQSEERERAIQLIDAELASLSGRSLDLAKGDGAQLIGVAGTITTIASWKLKLPCFDRDAIDHCVLSVGDVEACAQDLFSKTHSLRLATPGIEKGREDVILAGALILWRAMKVLGFSECRVSTRGLRYGAILAD